MAQLVVAHPGRGGRGLVPAQQWGPPRYYLGCGEEWTQPPATTHQRVPVNCAVHPAKAKPGQCQ